MLNRCIGTDPQTFAREHWGRLPLLTRAADLPRDFADLLSVDGVDELLSERGVRAPFIRVAKEGEVLARECYLGPAGFGAEMPDQVDSAKVLGQFASGATIVLQGLHRLWPPMIDFVRAMVDDLGQSPDACGYHRLPGGQRFHHCDAEAFHSGGMDIQRQRGQERGDVLLESGEMYMIRHTECRCQGFELMFVRRIACPDDQILHRRHLPNDGGERPEHHVIAFAHEQVGHGSEEHRIRGQPV